jgi:hypothetical protein
VNHCELAAVLAKDISKKFDDLEKFVDKKKEELSEKLFRLILRNLRLEAIKIWKPIIEL